MKQVTTIGLTALLAACGGGSDGPSVSVSPSAQVTTAEGIWEGKASNGVAVSLAILENGETYGVYTSNGTIVGALYGNTTSNSTTLSGSGKDFNIPTRTVGSGTYSGTFTAKSSINVTTSSGSSFAGTYSASYDQPASAQALAGTFSGVGVSGNSPVQATSVVITASGAVTMPASLGCSASGTATPRPSGKNIFDLTLRFSGNSCALGDGATTSGVIYYEAVTQRILAMGLNATKSDGFIYVGQK